MTVNIHPNTIASYREGTDKPKMENAIFCRFICPVCKTSRPIAGRVSRGYKRGFRCAVCNESRKEKLWNKAQQQAANVKNLHSQESKDRQVVLLCDTLLEAMKGDNNNG